MGFNENLKMHLETGTTCVARAWEIVRRDGERLGFTDHDRDLTFQGLTFSAKTGLTAQALAQSTGLSVDNGEAIGALTDDAISEADLDAGRYDGAEVKLWLVNWMKPDDHTLLFRGSVGEITRSGQKFKAELRGLAEILNQPQGRLYQKTCTAVLGDEDCTIDVSGAAFSSETNALSVTDARVFDVALMPSYAERWFERGILEVLSGPAAGLTGVIKGDTVTTAGRRFELWQSLRSDVSEGDLIRVVAGCDKRSETCRVKFSNFLNFRGFPDIPGEDWQAAYPRQGGENDGGSRRR